MRLRIIVGAIVTVVLVFCCIKPVFSQTAPTAQAKPQPPKVIGSDWRCLPHLNAEDDTTLVIKLKGQGFQAVKVESKDRTVFWNTDDGKALRVDFARVACATDKARVTYKVITTVVVPRAPTGFRIVR